MENRILSAAALSDAALVSEVDRLTREEREGTAQLIAMLSEFDARRLYLPAGCSSLFTYCTQVLRLSEHAAYHRIEAARAGRRYPEIIERLASADLTLTTVTVLAPHLTEVNCRALLDSARHKSKREVEELVAALRPKPDVPSAIRRLPARSLGVGPVPGEMAKTSATAPSDGAASEAPPSVFRQMESAAPSRPAVVTPLAPERYKLQVTISLETHDKLRRAQDLLRHVVLNGDLAAIVDRALSLLVANLEKRKLAAVKSPRAAQAKPGAERKDKAPIQQDDQSSRRDVQRSRNIPAAVRRSVWVRDQGQCAYIGTAGRCTERGQLEFHHVVPYADGGRTTADNMQLRCRRHNQYEAERWFGEAGSLVREVPPVWAIDKCRFDSVQTELRGS